MSERLITGGSGKLGKELQKHLPGIYPSHEEFDIINSNKVYDCSQVIHSAAYTKVKEAETHGMECFTLNVAGTLNLLNLYEGKPFVYISTETAKDPVNLYSWSKKIGELLVKSLAKEYLIIRTSFKPNPYPWDVAFTDSYTQGDYVDVIGALVADKIKSWDQKPSLVYVGTGRKTIYDLAIRTRPDVKPNSVNDIKGVTIPKDYL